MTPETDDAASCTVFSQPPHFIPLTVRLIVFMSYPKKPPLLRQMSHKDAAEGALKQEPSPAAQKVFDPKAGSLKINPTL